ncbi:MAG: helix-turn-helix transcriptional regulator [Acidobacteriota bacterium]|nr:helix-turn-helix transcriptional regulator [Acidobacteriota bacterium]
MRQTAKRRIEPGPGDSIATLAWEYPPGYDVSPHRHSTGQLIYAIRGVMEISTGATSWLIPPHFAVWIPARVEHRIHMRGAVSMRTLYIRAPPVRRDGCAVLQVSPLLRELILETVRLGRLTYRNPLHRSLRSLLLDSIARSAPGGISLTMPSDPRALQLARSMLNPAARLQSVAALCTHAGASVRTVERLFLRELGVSIETWRRQMRLMTAIGRLIEGVPIKLIAHDLGYRHPTPFIEMFRRTLGVTPGAWLAANS